MLVQITNVIIERNPIQRFNYAGAIALSSCILTGILGLNLWTIDSEKSDKDIRIVELVLSVVAIVASISVPRRPDVFHNGMLVDQANNVSLLQKYTFSWCSAMIALANKKNELTMVDLPYLINSLRARELHDRFEYTKGKLGLARSILRSHAVSLILQLILTLTSTSLYVLPQIAMYNLLRVLEARDAGGENGRAAIIWVFALGLATLAQSFMDSVVS